MLLISPQTLASALGIPIRSPDGTGEDGLLEALRILTSRIEGMLSVGTLSRGTFEDTFYVPSLYEKKEVTLRLHNAFLTEDVPVISSVDGVARELTIKRVDRTDGLVTLSGIYGTPAELEVQYVSGFTVPEDEGPEDMVHIRPEFRVAQDAPAWMEDVVTQAYVWWRRNTLANPGVTKEYGFLPSLNEATIRSMKAAVYNQYMRPRAGVLMPVSHWAVP